LLLEDVLREEKKSNKRDFYKILEVSKGAKQEDVRKSYKKLASKWHPDKNNESEEQRDFADKKFKDINEDYSILSDERKRMIYDKGEHPDNPNSSFHTDFKNQEEAYDETYDFYKATDKTDPQADRSSKKEYHQDSYYKSKKKEKREGRY